MQAAARAEQPDTRFQIPGRVYSQRSRRADRAERDSHGTQTPTGGGNGAAVPVLERTWAVVLLSAALLGETNVMPAWQCAAALALVVAGIWVVNRRAARGRRGGWCRKDTRPPCDTRLQCDADDQRAGASRRPASSWPATQAATPRAKLSSMYVAAVP